MAWAFIFYTTMIPQFEGWIPVPMDVVLIRADVWVWVRDNDPVGGSKNLLSPNKHHAVTQYGSTQDHVASGSVNNPWRAYRPIKEALTTMKDYTESYLKQGIVVVKKDGPRPKPTKFKKDEEEKTPPGERVSVYHNIYPESKESDWIGYDGAGWVHASEKICFQAEHQMCIVSKTWHKNSFMVSTRTGECVNKREVKTGNWEMCKSTGYAYPKHEMVDAYDNDGTVMRVCMHCLETKFFKDDMDKRFYQNSSHAKVKIYSSEKYKLVSSYNVNRSNKFCSCDHCGHFFEKAAQLVLPRPDLAQNMCNGCYEAQMNKNVIKAHNHTDYPKPIFTQPRKALVTKEAVARTMEVMKTLQHPLSTTSWEDANLKKVFLYGVEIETEFTDPDIPGKRSRLALQAWKALGQDFCIIKHDGSLHGKRDPEAGEKIRRGGEFGFEIVTAPCDIATHRDRWHRIETMENYGSLRAWDVGTCGMHVHVSRAPMTSLQVCRISYMMNHPKLKDFVQLVAGRCAARYNKFIPKKNVSDGGKPEMDKDKYTAINIKHAHTVEFRIFRGTVNWRHIIRNLEFVEAVVRYCNPGDRSLKDLGDEKAIVKFINQHEKEWPELNRWLRTIEDFEKILKPNEGAFGPKDLRTLKGEKPIKVDEAVDPSIPVKPAKKKPEEKQANLKLGVEASYT